MSDTTLTAALVQCRECCIPVEHLDWVACALLSPVEYRCSGDERECVVGDPLPEDHLISNLEVLELLSVLNAEYL